MLHDLRLVIRALLRQPSFTLAALATLALGIAATTAMFAAVYGVLLRPLPYPDADRLVQVSEVVPGGTPAISGPMISTISIHAWEPHRRTVGPIAHFGGGSVTVGFDTPQRLVRGNVAPHFFDVIGVRPVLGRFFVEQDAAAGAAPVVVISAELWRDGFGSDPAIAGRRIVVEESPHEIIGVAPAAVALPTSDTRLWTPGSLGPPPGPDNQQVGATRAITRLLPGVTPAQAAAEATALARGVTRPRAADMLFGKGGPVEVHVRTVTDQMTMGVRPALLVLLVGVGLLLLITCANVANLFLSRGASGERDRAVRVALGAARARLIRETLAEALVICGAGGAIGVALAAGLLAGLPAIAPATFPRLDAITLDAFAVMFAVAASLIAAAITGLIPAFRSARADLLPSLRDGAGASRGPRTLRTHRVLLAAESTLAVMLLIGAALMGRSFVNLVQTDAGYDAANVLTARIYLPGASRGEAQTNTLLAELLPRLRALPDVVAAGASNMAPFGRSTYVSSFEVPVPGREPVVARTQSYVITPGYTEALRLRLHAGRVFEDRDVAAGRQSVLVNEQFVRMFLRDADPIGLRFGGQYGAGEIIGVVGDVLKNSLDQEPQAEMYLLAAGEASIRREVYLVMRTTGDPIAYADTVRSLVTELRRDAAVEALEPLSAQLAASVAQPRFAATVLLSFAGIALLLAAVGLYGVLSYSVARRQREIGVRGALGATRGHLVRMIVSEGLGVTAIGLALGLLLAAGATRFMQSLLVGVAPIDPWSFGLAALGLLLVALVASAVPARRALRVDPVTALRAE
ncbi:MAG TPA: ADOP family duplicated permease [Vicinamibacterales bacterium]|nr:ADOP family duplicated permease [Vicinamibacterales bacterium]